MTRIINWNFTHQQSYLIRINNLCIITYTKSYIFGSFRVRTIAELCLHINQNRFLMKAIFVIQTSPDENQASILNDVQTQIDQLWSEFQPQQTTHYLTQQEVAWKLNRDIRTIRKYSRIGLLKAYRFGHRVFYKRHELIGVLTSMQF